MNLEQNWIGRELVNLEFGTVIGADQMVQQFVSTDSNLADDIQ